MNSLLVNRFFTALMLSTMFAVPASIAAQQNTKHARYKAVEIPTFGGPASYINPASVFGSHTQINSQSAAVGAAATSIPALPTSNGFVCFGPAGAVPFIYHAFEWRNGRTTDLGTLSGANECSEATSINASGQVVGTSEKDEIDPILGVKQIRAVRWEHSGIKSLGTFGGNASGAAANNNRGQVVGFAQNAIPDPFSFFYNLLVPGITTGTQTRAFLWQNGELQDLGTLGGSDAAAFVLNERGDVGGVSSINSEPDPTTGQPIQHLFVWEDGIMIDVGSLGGSVSTPVAINNRRQLIGSASTANEEVTDPLFWQNGKLIDLFTETEGKVITANAINDSGQVVGGGDFSSTGGSPFSAVVWKKGVATNLGTLPGDCFSEAVAINSKEQIVGYSRTCDTFQDRAFLWEQGTMIDLNQRVPSDFSLRLASAVAINERGEIGGFGAPAGCSNAELCGRAFLLIPTGHEDESTNDAVGNKSPVNQNVLSSAGLTGRAVAAKIHGQRRRSSEFGVWHH